MTNKTVLESATDDFFKLYWNEVCVRDPRPTWSTWNLEGIPPEAAMGGCYAIYKDDELLYIGVAVTEGKNATKTGKKYGLLNRLERHVLQKGGRGSKQYRPLDRKPQWQGITTVRLIGFPDQHRHLAAALEAYLISRVPTVVNAQARWRSAEPHTAKSNV